MRRHSWNDLPQTEQIHRYIRRHRRTGITPAIAREVFGIQRLAARVGELRKAGTRIATRYEVDEMGKRFARYVLR